MIRMGYTIKFFELSQAYNGNSILPSSQLRIALIEYRSIRVKHRRENAGSQHNPVAIPCAFVGSYALFIEREPNCHLSVAKVDEGYLAV